jgi:hypothetical protein
MPERRENTGAMTSALLDVAATPHVKDAFMVERMQKLLRSSAWTSQVPQFVHVSVPSDAPVYLW